MPKQRPALAVDRMDTGRLWDLAFRVRYQLDHDLMDFRHDSPLRGEVRLLGSIMAELRSRSAQGTLSV